MLAQQHWLHVLKACRNALLWLRLPRVHAAHSDAGHPASTVAAAARARRTRTPLTENKKRYSRATCSELPQNAHDDEASIASAATVLAAAAATAVLRVPRSPGLCSPASCCSRPPQPRAVRTGGRGGGLPATRSAHKRSWQGRSPSSPSWWRTPRKVRASAMPSTRVARSFMKVALVSSESEPAWCCGPIRVTPSVDATCTRHRAGQLRGRGGLQRSAAALSFDHEKKLQV